MINIRAEQLIGQTLPSTFGGASGRGAEDLLEELGINIDRKGTYDIPFFNLEVKTRDVDAISAQTVGARLLTDIVNTPYINSPICKKFQHQLRIKTKENVIISAEIYDFSPAQIQDLIREAYEEGRGKMTRLYLTDKPVSDWVKGTKWGNFERVNKQSNSWHFRINNDRMEELENMATSMFNNFFEVA